jgi:hypothetical protein
MAFKEIGELYLDKNIKTGVIKSRNNALVKKTILFPDSERLLYNYSSNPHVRDMAHYTNGIDDHLIFVGRNVFIDYNSNSGNFYCENPRYVLRSLIRPVSDGGLGISEHDLFAICENLQYALVLDNWVYIISQIANGNTILFRYDIITRTVENVCHDEFATAIGDSFLFCKPIEYGKELYFFMYYENNIAVYTYNIVTNIFQKHNTLTSGLVDFNQPSVITPHTISALLDRVNKKIIIIACVDNNVFKVYNLLTGLFETVQQNTVKLAGKHMASIAINDGYDSAKLPNEYIVCLTDDNSITCFSSNYTTGFLITKIIITGIHGVTGVTRSKENTIDAKYLVFYKKEDSSINYITIDAQSLDGTTKNINVSTKNEPLMEIFSNNISISGWFNNDIMNLNISYGSYEEAGLRRIFIKQLGSISLNDGTHPYINQGNLEASSGIIAADGVAYGNTQMSRLHLRAEQIDSASSIVDPSSTVYLHEHKDDKMQFTTGSYLWKELYKVGLPFNAHVETAGRIVIDGFDIPISKTMITRNKEGESYGDILFTFDKHFNPNIITNALQEKINQYPGILFFKNKGFLNDAVISSSYEMEGSPVYNDDPQGDLFSAGIHAITASALIDDSILLVAGSYGCLASINIKTMGYTNINGESHGDEPPLYYRPYQTVTYPDTIKAIIPYKKKIFILTNRGFIFKIMMGGNIWEEIPVSDVSSTSNPIHYLNNRNCKAHAIKDNLLIISWPFGAISSFDMESDYYISIENASLYPSTPYISGGQITGDVIAGDSIAVGSRIYFIGDKSSNSGKTLCWFDVITKTFGYAKDPPGIIASRTKNKVDLASDGKIIYMLIANSNNATLVKYDIENSEYAVLASTVYTHSRCGLYYWDNKLYALFGIDSSEKRYIQVFTINTGVWHSYLISNVSFSILYDAKGIIHEGIDVAGRYFVKIKVFWGISSDVSPETVDNANIIEIDLINTPHIQDSLSIGTNLDSLFNNTRFIGYNIQYDKERELLLISNGILSGTTSLSNKIYRFDLNTNTLISSIDENKPLSTWQTVAGLFNHTLYSIGGYTNASLATTVSMYIFNVREGSWNAIRALAYNPGKTLINGVVPVITAMKIIYPGNMLVMSYMDGGVGSMNLSTGEMILPTHITPVTLSSIHAPAGVYSDRGAYNIFEDDEDVVFIGIDREFKFAKNVGVFFKKCPTDSENFTFTIDSKSPYPVGGCSQVAIGKYILYFNGYDQNEVNWKAAIHRNVIVLDTSTGEYAVLASDTLIRYKYNAYSYYYNGYIYTFGGICKEDQWTGSENVTRYNRRAVIERYDLVTGKVIELATKYGVDLNETDNRNVGQNQIIELSPVTFFGTRKNPTILASLITSNDSLPGSDTIKQWYFFDLITESIYKSIMLGSTGPSSTSVTLLCEQKSTHDLYSFEFNMNGVDKNTHAKLTIKKNIINPQGSDIISSVVKEVVIASPVIYRSFVAGLTNIIYDENWDTFVIPCLQRETTTVSDKSFLGTTISYIYDPSLNHLFESARDGTNLIRLSLNNCAIPLDKGHIDIQQQDTINNILPVYEINENYIIVNPHSEVMVSYTKNELFGNKPIPLNDKPVAEWNPQQISLYNLFTFKENQGEIAQGVNPGRDPCFMHYRDQIIRAIIIDETLLEAAIIRTSLETLEFYPLPDASKSQYIIISFDLELKLFSVLYSEIIDGLSSHSYIVTSALIDGVIWSFLDYHSYTSDYSPIISYDINTHSWGKHIYSRIEGDAYSVHNSSDYPRCIVNANKNIMYLIVVNRASTNAGFNCVIYAFHDLTYHNHISNVDIPQTVYSWDIGVPSGTEYYTNVSINVNGYIIRNKLYIDIFNGQNGEVSYTHHIDLLDDGRIDPSTKVSKISNDFIRNFLLKDTVYMRTYKNGIIQDIAGYQNTIYEGNEMLTPIIAVDSTDVLNNSEYTKTRTFILFDPVEKEIPKATITLPYSNDSAYVIIPIQDKIVYLDKKSDNKVYIITKYNNPLNKYTSFRQSGFLPIPKNIGINKIIKTKTIPVSENDVIMLIIPGGDNGSFFYRFNRKTRLFSLLNRFRYTTQNTLSNIDGDFCIVDSIMYLIGTQPANDNYLTLISYDLYSGNIIDIKTLVNTTIKKIKCIYHPRENKIYIFGGIINSTSLPNATIYSYDIKTKTLDSYITSLYFDSEVVDAYYNESLDETFIQLKVDDAPSAGKLLRMNHQSKSIEKLTTQVNPIATERMIETRGKALVYINKNMALASQAHYIFDPVTLNYIASGGCSISGSGISNIVPSEVIALNRESLFLGVSAAQPSSEIKYQSNFSSQDGWVATGMTGSVESSKLKGIITESVDASNIYFQRPFTDAIKQSEITIEFSGAYDLKDAPLEIRFSDGTHEVLKAIPVINNKYKFIIYSYYTKTINGIRIYPSYSVVPGRVLYINSITIKKQNTFISSDLQWATGPLFFANAIPSPIDNYATRRLFTYDGKLYMYGKENQHEIHIYDEEYKSFILYDGAIHNQAAIPDSSYYCCKVYLDGTVRLCFINPSQSQNSIKISFILYQIISKTVIAIDTISVPIAGNSENTLDFNSLSVKPLWVSHYFLTILTSSNRTDNYFIKIDFSSKTGVSYNCGSSINSKMALEWFYDKIIALGGAIPNGSDNDDNHLDTSYQLSSFRFTELAITNSLEKLTLPVTNQTDKRASFFSVKSAKKISSLFINNFSENNLQQEAIANYNDAMIDIITANLAKSGGNGETNGDKYTPYLNKYLPKQFSNELQVAAFENGNYLSDSRIKIYHIPYKDNKMLIGVYDKLIYPTHSSNIPNYNNSTKLRAITVRSDLIGIYFAYNYIVKIYSGVTSDSVIVLDRNSYEIIDSLSFERDYGSVITNIEELEENKFILIYDAAPAIGSVIIHDDGKITVKRYDGTVFGRTIDPGSNNHIIQEVDLTFLFDVESSEYGLRKEG